MHDPEAIEQNMDALLAGIEAENRLCESRRNTFIAICFAASVILGFLLYFDMGVAPGMVIVPTLVLSVVIAHLLFRPRNLTLDDVKKAAGDTGDDTSATERTG